MKLKLRLSDNIDWAYEFEAESIETLKDNVRIGWERYIEEKGGVDLSQLGHPAIAYRTREVQVKEWLKKHLSRDADDQLKKEWERQAAHWIGRARRDFGEVGRHLHIHVFHESSGTWKIMARGASQVPRIITDDKAVEILAAVSEAEMSSEVVEADFPNTLGLRLIKGDE